MKQGNVAMLWEEPALAARFRTAVCLHGHTLHSEECLSFLPRYLNAVPLVAPVARGYQRGPQAVDFGRAYWTPPLTAASALALEREQIAALGLRPIVSLTDHDNIGAGMALQVAHDRGRTPVSVEWTVPWRRSIFHLGIHNLPPEKARSWMASLETYTSSGSEELLPDMLSELDAIPDVLIVLNHPFWLEEGVEEEAHRLALPHILRTCGRWFHALELNGTRRWTENRLVLELAREWNLPVISGGDRHACEPAACLNLTDARNFSEFAAEVRGGSSTVIFMPQYREPMPLRFLEAIRDILRPYPEYPGRVRWTDRVFYRGADRIARPVSLLWNERVPLAIRPLAGLLQLFANPGFRPALRFLLARVDEARP